MKEKEKCGGEGLGIQVLHSLVWSFSVVQNFHET